MQTEIFAKEKPGLSEAVNFLKNFTNRTTIYTGNVGDGFPQEPINRKRDLVISYMSPWIIPKEILDNTRKYAINFHPGPPEYPGIGCTNFAIYHEDKQFGVTAHIMEPKVDSGKIIAVKRFPIADNETVYSLTERCYTYILKMFYEVISKVFAEEDIFTCNEEWKRKPYTRRELDELCRITFDMEKKEIAGRIRATTYPDKQGAFIDISNFRFAFQKPLTKIPNSLNIRAEEPKPSNQT